MVRYLLGDRPDWYDEAKCMGMETAVFFGDEEDQQEHSSHRPYLLPEQVREAKNVCASCPVIDECLTEALENDIEHGIWGGLHWKERQKLKAGTHVIYEGDQQVAGF